MSPSAQIRIFDPQESRLERAIRDIEHEVAEKYAGRWEWAGWLGRLILKYQMQAEIDQRLERLIPRLPWLMRQDSPHAPHSVQQSEDGPRLHRPLTVDQA
ncbi:MAG: hypothetical protein U0903_08135 [Planctomycetales bacterium]